MKYRRRLRRTASGSPSRRCCLHHRRWRPSCGRRFVKILLQGRFQRLHLRRAPHVADLLQRRQLGQRIQAQVVEELLRRAQQGRAPDHFAVADHVDPAAVFQHLDRLRIDRDAADLFDVAARDRLAVGDDRQRFQRGARILRRLFRAQAVEVLLHFGPALEAPAAGQADHLDAAVVPVVAQFFEHQLDGVGADAGAQRAAVVVDVDEQLLHAVDRHRLARAQQGGFEDSLGLISIHNDVVSGSELKMSRQKPVNE